VLQCALPTRIEGRRARYAGETVGRARLICHHAKQRRGGRLEEREKGGAVRVNRRTNAQEGRGGGAGRGGTEGDSGRRGHGRERGAAGD
jgi:hypothetical protein